MTRYVLVLSCAALSACQPAVSPELTMISDRATFDGRMQRAIITLTAADSHGLPGTGSVSLVAAAGEFIEGNEVQLVNGVTSVTFRCDPNEQAACDGALRLGATWGTQSATVQVKVTPSTPVVTVKWKVMPTYTLETLNDIVVGPGNTYWAVGTGGVVIRIVNDNWFRVETGVATTLRAAWTDGVHLVVVGDANTFLVWNGSKFDLLPLDGLDDFSAIAGTANALLAVSNKGRVAHYDGTGVGFEWLGDDVLRAIAQSDSGDTWVLGEKYWYRSDLTKWSTVTPPVLGNWASARFGPDGLWVAGARDTDNGPAGVVLTGPTPDWKSSTVTSGLLRDIFFVTGSDERFAVNESGVFRKPGTSDWQVIDSPAGGLAVAGRSATDIMVVGAGGVSIRRVQ